MKWKKEPYPKLDARRELLRFAWKPREIGDHIVWLEFYSVNQRYHIPSYCHNAGWWECDGPVIPRGLIPFVGRMK